MCELISRQAAIDAVNGMPDCPNGYSDTYDKAHIVAVLEDVPSAQPDDAALHESCTDCPLYDHDRHSCPRFNKVIPTAIRDAQPRWIPVTERLPEDIRPVIVTWKNNDPESYYQNIVGKHFIGVAHFKGGKWYWYSSTTEDYLAEYGRYDGEEFDEAIEVVAWMPLPEPYKGGESDA